MSPQDSVFKGALSTLLVEIFDGPPGKEAYVLNPGDRGLLRELEALDAAAASTRATAGKTTIAAHADHVLFGLSLLNRWAGGEANPWADADWDASWKRTMVDEQQWQALRGKLREACATWKRAVEARNNWDDVAAAGGLASVAHTAYHLGAIRQLIAAMNKA
jgi:hypothetical protein